MTSHLSIHVDMLRLPCAAFLSESSRFCLFLCFFFLEGNGSADAHHTRTIISPCHSPPLLPGSSRSRISRISSLSSNCSSNRPSSLCAAALSSPGPSSRISFCARRYRSKQLITSLMMSAIFTEMTYFAISMPTLRLSRLVSSCC